MVSTSPYAEIRETRIRTRLAMHAGFGVHGIVPFQSEHIGYVKFALRVGEGKNDRNLTKEILFPYELFEGPAMPGSVAAQNPALSTGVGAASAKRRIVLLWIPEEPFMRNPLERLRALSDMLTFCACSNPARTSPLKIIGPPTSTTLKAIIADVADCASGGNCADSQTTPGFKFYSPVATMPAKRLIAGICKSPANCNFSTEGDASRWMTAKLLQQDISLVRTIATDDALINAILWELALRNADPSCSVPSQIPGFPPAKWCRSPLVSVQRQPPYYGYNNHVVILSEWDTDYGRSLPDLFDERVQQSLGLPMPIGGAKVHNVHRFGYVRGLDGDLPDQSDGDKPDRDKAHRDPLEAVYEPAIGSNQFDYLRRLTERIRELDRELQDRGEGRIRAFGILGSDVYDKLLILRALKREFPKHLYFTNDLDARYLDNVHYPATRNLIIASSFGLQLSPALQAGIAPFRSSYQTAAFLAARLVAVSPTADLSCVQDLVKPHIYEVGRHRFFDLPLPGEEVKPFSMDGCLEALRPPRSYGDARLRLYPEPRTESNSLLRHWSHGLALVVVCVGAVFLMLLSLRRVRRLVRSVWCRVVTARRRKSNDTVKGATYPDNGGWMVGLAITLLLASITLPLAYLLMQNLPEVWAWSSGVSIWPSELIRLFAGFLSVVLICMTMIGLTSTDFYLRRHFYLDADDSAHEPDPVREILACGKRHEKKQNGDEQQDETDGQGAKAADGTDYDSFPDVPRERRCGWWCDIRAFYRWHDHAVDVTTEYQKSRRKLKHIRNSLASAGLVQAKRSSDLSPEMEKDNKSRDIKMLWQDYRYFARPRRRFVRAGLATLILWGLSFAVLFGFGDIAYPGRGISAHWVGLINGMGLLFIPFLLLLFLVMDETRLVAALSRYLCHEGMHWPEQEGGRGSKTGFTSTGAQQGDAGEDGQQEDAYGQFSGARRLSDDIATVEFLAQRTRPTGNLIWYPMIVIMLVLFSLSTRFDNYASPMNVLALILAVSAIAVSSAVVLRRSAYLAKQTIVNTLEAQVLASRKPQEQGGNRTEMVIEHIQGISRGAFRSITEDPVTQALLWVLSIAAVIVSEYYAVAGI